ncbi:MAG: cupin domain-containing protein [Verrucomicrobiae bacterium]
MKTTRFIRGQENYTLVEEPCHNGIGPWKMKSVIEHVEKKEQLFIKFIHDDIIPPGSSIGYHQHKNDEPEEEWYYCLEGEGIMTLDGKDYDISVYPVTARFHAFLPLEANTDPVDGCRHACSGCRVDSTRRNMMRIHDIIQKNN